MQQGSHDSLFCSNHYGFTMSHARAAYQIVLASLRATVQWAALCVT